MPFAFYKVLTPNDLDAVTAYVRSVRPVRNEVQPPVYRAASHAELIPGAEKPMSEEELRDPVKRGFYLATIAHCMECHARRPDGTQDYVNSWGKGGYEFKDVLGSCESFQHHLALSQRHRRLDRCRDQAGTNQRRGARRPRLQAPDGAPHLFQQDDRRRSQCARRLASHPATAAITNQWSCPASLPGIHSPRSQVANGLC